MWNNTLKILKIWKYKFKQIVHLLEWGSNPQLVGFTVTLCAPAARLASNNGHSYYICIFVT